MKHIFVNFKRFDIPKDLGGVNSIAPMETWARTIVEATGKHVNRYKNEAVDFTMFFPEAHLINAVSSRDKNTFPYIGCQGVYREDTAVGGNFGSFTTNLTANAARAMGCTTTIIGHCEERKDKAGILANAGVVNNKIVNILLNKSIKCAAEAGLKVLYCIGERPEEQNFWQEVLKEQIDIGLDGVDRSKVCIAYEPVWAIGPGKTPPDRGYIKKIAGYVKEITGGLDVVYGGGLKEDNAQMLASIKEIDGGLIALTRFSGDIGFYPEEYIKIVEKYLKGRN